MSRSPMQNPFPRADKDRHALWEMLVKRDIQAFLAEDWSQVESDFIESEFFGIDAHQTDNPDAWTLNFPTLADYRDSWLEQAKTFADTEWDCDVEQAMYQLTHMRDIDVSGDRALLHKKFDGCLAKADGTQQRLRFQTLYRCRKVDNRWRIAGFTGYLPLPMGIAAQPNTAVKTCPINASQHATAGPYSPVLQVNGGQWVVISGQAAIDPQGRVIGDTIEEQTRLTLENCRQQLQAAGCDFGDVFKVNVFLENLDDWPRFNAVYESYLPEPRPVRTAVQAGLLMELIVEVEMWAVKL